MVQNFTRDRDETKSLVYFSLETDTRPRLSPISVLLARRSARKRNRIARSSGGEGNRIVCSFRGKGIRMLVDVRGREKE